MALSGCAGSGTRRSPSTADDAQRAAEVNLELGQGYMRRGDNKIALEKLQNAIRLDPNSAAAHTVIAVLYERLGLQDKAEQYFQRSVELAPENGEILNNFGTHLCRRQRYAEADALFVRALKDPFYPTPAALLGNAGSCALQAGNAVQAEAYFRRALQHNARQPQSLYQLAQIELEKGNALSARAFIQRYEAVAPASPQLFELGARIETVLGDSEAAANYRSRLRTEFPDYQPTTASGGATSP
ncbi:MAG: type IV pilus biogenesis/stability protein PilW [Xanthomonadales bacterium]|nr:type IV pilus biogenesis/stability protein PilW [Xanthomonadales bacterium]